ncbi:DUF2059 domain-containing protein [Pukyongiella litopenaei]|uniref:DUF2059 domain-containing protein n=2 Tax=Pukyongiella litopenaei TaxID=2605946 RepID=A0A2S0MUX1_9RHOB|nr:DUF2059 domain-containing protein [Pukyongiella litopenaei]
MRRIACLTAGLMLILLTGIAARAADSARIAEFLRVTGFDVALDSIALSAESAPAMLGFEDDAFGDEWARLARLVFDAGVMRGLADDLLEAGLDDALLDHAVGFYATDLGQRLVEVENEAHSDPDGDARLARAEQLVARLADTEPARLELLERMNRAIDASGNSLRAIQEVQVRFLVAAHMAGIVELRMDPDEMRAFMREQEAETRREMERSALLGAAWTYRDFTDAEIETYLHALEEPQMQAVYALLNAVQYEIMANRFEALAAQMAGWRRGQDI